MLRFRYRFAFVVILIFFACHTVYAFNTYRAGEEITGEEYNDVWMRWFDKKFSIWVGVDEDNTEYIFFKGETGLGDATVMVQYSETIKRKLKKAITKAIEWSDVARKNRADTTKSLGCFGRNKWGRGSGAEGQVLNYELIGAEGHGAEGQVLNYELIVNLDLRSATGQVLNYQFIRNVDLRSSLFLCYSGVESESGQANRSKVLKTRYRKRPI